MKLWNTIGKRIAEIFLLRIWGMDSFDLWRVQFRVVIVDGQVDCLGGVVH